MDAAARPEDASEPVGNLIGARAALVPTLREWGFRERWVFRSLTTLNARDKDD